MGAFYKILSTHRALEARMLPALPLVIHLDPLRDPAVATRAPAGRGDRPVPRVDAVPPQRRGESRAANRERPEDRQGAAPDTQRRAAWRDDRAGADRRPGATHPARWGATLFLAQHLGQLDGAGGTRGADTASQEARSPSYDGPDPHGFGTAAYRRVGAEPPLYREAPVVFRVSV